MYPRRLLQSSVSRLTSRPAKPKAVPEVGERRPVSIRIVVDLPDPFGPRKPKTFPRGMSKLTSSTATNEPNLRTRFSAHRKTSGGGEAGPHGDAVRREDLEERPRVGREDLVARPYGEEPAAVEESDPGGVLGLVHVGGRDDDGEAAVVQLGEDLPELAARDGVDPGCRLVDPVEDDGVGRCADIRFAGDGLGLLEDR